MSSIFRRKLKLLLSRVRRVLRGRARRPRVLVRRLGKWSKRRSNHPKIVAENSFSEKPIRIATFNVAMFTLAPAISSADDERREFTTRPLKSILRSPLSGAPGRSKLRVSINLPDNEISLARSPLLFPPSTARCWNWCDDGVKTSRSVLEVLREVDADILALQDVKAEEEKGMKPLSDLAAALGMNYVFAESWAPEFGNAVLSKWPIKAWSVQKIADNDDFRNVLKAAIDVPWAGEVSLCCTQLDHLDESWRMKQIGALYQASDSPHILAGGLNSLNGSDYSSERWADIVKYYEDMGKPTPKVEVMKFLKGKGYTDAKDYAGECEPVVIIAKGQNVQGTCKYGTRVDYVLSSSKSPYKFVPGSYSVVSSKGTSDHHLVKVDIVKEYDPSSDQNLVKRHQASSQKLVSGISSACYSRHMYGN